MTGNSDQDRIASGTADRIIRRIVAESGVPDLYDALARRISPSDLQSLLLSVFRSRSAERTPGDVVRQYSSNRYVQPSRVSPARAIELDRLAFSLLPDGFQAIELSPLSPFSCCSALGPVDQNRIVTTTRNSEVCSDPTNVLALEAASRRAGTARLSAKDRADGRTQHGADQSVRLCASQRVIRAQEAQGAVSFPHFRVLALCTAGRTVGNLSREEDAILEQICYYIALLGRAHSLGYAVASIRVVLCAYSGQAQDRIQSLADRLRNDGTATAEQRDVTVETSVAATEKHSYYQDYRIQIHGTTTSGQEYFLVDGGLVPWTARLLNNRKEFCMTSGMGTERLIAAWSGDENDD